MRSFTLFPTRARILAAASTLRRASLVVALLAASALAACSDTSAPAATPAVKQRTTSPPLSGDAVLRGQVLGVDSANGGPWHTSPIGGATVTAIHVWKDPAAGPDTARTPAILTTIGTTTADANGLFELRNVPTGYFFLDVSAPTSTGYRSGRAGSVSFPAGSTDRAFVYLYR
jgi:hypothetical protein